MTYPAAFYVAHKLFSGPAFTVPAWGDVLDGPVTDFEMVITLIWDSFDDAPTRDTLRVTYIEDGRAENVTAAALAAINDRIEALNG